MGVPRALGHQRASIVGACAGGAAKGSGGNKEVPRRSLGCPSWTRPSPRSTSWERRESAVHEHGQRYFDDRSHCAGVSLPPKGEPDHVLETSVPLRCGKQRDRRFDLGRLRGAVTAGKYVWRRWWDAPLQNYIGHTGDVQSAALVLGFVGNLSLLEDRLGQEIVAGYRDLLNRWEMFRERARFDCDRANIERSVGSMNGQGIPSKTKPYVPKWIMKSQLSVSLPLFFSILFHWRKCTSKTNHIVLYAKGSLRLLQRVVFDTDDNTKRERLPTMACAREKCNPSMPKLQAWPAKVLRLPLDSWKQQPVHHIRDKTEELVRRQGQGEKRRERVARRSRKKLLKRR